VNAGTVANIELERSLGLRQAVAMGVGGTIGGGIFLLVGAAAGVAGPAALVGFALAFLAAALIALPYAELSCRYPLAGGGYAFTRAVLGAPAGFLMGWGYWGAYLFVSGIVTIGFGGYFAAFTGADPTLGAVAMVLACTVLNLLGVRMSARVQVAVVATAGLGLVAFGLWGLGHVDPGRLTPFAPHGIGGVASSVLIAFLAFGGFDMVAAAGEEIDRPERNLPKAIFLTLAIVLGLYMTVCLVALGAMGWRELGDSPAPLADAAARFGGSPARMLVLVVAVLTTAATANAVLVVTSRISFAMARDGLLPAALGRVSPVTSAPSRTILISGALMAAIALIGSVRLVAAAGGFLYVLHFVVPLAALVVLRRRAGTPPVAFRTPLPRVTLPLAFAACAALIVASGATGAAAGGGWLALGLAGYRLAGSPP
jgi:basic amino acid/polyamine antiporter, APA family